MDKKVKYKKFINEYSPFFIEIESKKDLPILLENLKRLVMQKYNNLENRCQLAEIQVSPIQNCDTQKADESMCTSYEYEK